MRGPIDYIIVGFEKPQFDGSILSELQKSVANGTIAVLALVVVAKDKDGVVTAVDLSEDTLTIVQSFNLDNDLVDEDDLSEVGDLLENGSAAGLLVVEHLWAKGLKQAIVNSGGRLLVDGRIHPDANEELNQEENN